MIKIKALFHFHSSFSRDSNLSLENIVSFLVQNQIQAVALTDHNTIQGALALRTIIEEKKLPIKVIIGSEIATQDGEIIGLFLQKEISPKLPLSQTIEEIKKQNGIVYLPHPFDSIRREKIKDKSFIEKNIDNIDIVEVFNSRNLKNKDNQKALALASQYQKVSVWASDAHFGFELPNCIVEMPDFQMDSKDFLAKLSYAHPLSCKKSYRGFFYSIMRKYLFLKVFSSIFL